MTKLLSASLTGTSVPRGRDSWLSAAARRAVVDPGVSQTCWAQGQGRCEWHRVYFEDKLLKGTCWPNVSTWKTESRHSGLGAGLARHSVSRLYGLCKASLGPSSGNCPCRPSTCSRVVETAVKKRTENPQLRTLATGREGRHLPTQKAVKTRLAGTCTGRREEAEDAAKERDWWAWAPRGQRRREAPVGDKWAETRHAGGEPFTRSTICTVHILPGWRWHGACLMAVIEQFPVE